MQSVFPADSAIGKVADLSRGLLAGAQLQPVDDQLVFAQHRVVHVQVLGDGLFAAHQVQVVAVHALLLDEEAVAV